MRIPRRTTQPEALLPALLVLTLLLALPGCSPELHEKAVEVHGDDATAAIVEWQSKRDDSVLTSALSPFTAVQSHYVNEGVTVRFGAEEGATARDPQSAMASMAAVTYREDAFWVEMVEGSQPPTIHGSDDDGEPVADGTPVDQSQKLEGDQVVGLGSYFLSMSPQSGFGRVIVYDPDTEMRREFQGFEWFPPAPAMKVSATWVPAAEPSEVIIATSRGLEKTYHRTGHFAFDVDGTPQMLVGLTVSANPEKGDSIFLPFRDATTGEESYDVGRYISVRYSGEGEEHFIDFNRATNPSCNYSDHYNCPIPPAENRLTVAIRAGEMTYPVHGS